MNGTLYGLHFSGMALLMLIGATASAAAQPATGRGPGTMADAGMMGAHLYENLCAVCHKADGSGGVRLGTITSADLRAPALEKMYNNSDEQLRRAILDGKNEDGESMHPVMPRWRGQMTRQEVAAIIAYLKTLSQ